MFCVCQLERRRIVGFIPFNCRCKKRFPSLCPIFKRTGPQFLRINAGAIVPLLGVYS
jgi:hypothetical protein